MKLLYDLGAFIQQSKQRNRSVLYDTIFVIWQAFFMLKSRYTQIVLYRESQRLIVFEYSPRLNFTL